MLNSRCKYNDCASQHVMINIWSVLSVLAALGGQRWKKFNMRQMFWKRCRQIVRRFTHLLTGSRTVMGPLSGLSSRKCLNVVTVPMNKMHNIGMVPTFKMHSIGTVLECTMKRHQKFIIFVWSWNLDCMAKINDCSLHQFFYLNHLGPIFQACHHLFNQLYG